MNKVILMGRLTRDPDIRYSTGDTQTAIARYTLAVDRRGRREDGQQNADFIGCIAFGKSAEFAERYLKKGTKIAITGRIQTGSYTNRDGQKVYTTDVVVEEQEFAESKGTAGAESGAGAAGNNGYNGNYGNNSNNGNSSYRKYTGQSNTAMGNGGAEGFMTIPEGVDELPFL